MTAPRATVRTVHGKLVLEDPDALAVIRAVKVANVFAAQRERVAHFVRRAAELGRRPADVVIVLLAVDDPAGAELAEHLMPGTDWQSIRDCGEVPFARGLAGRAGIEGIVDELDPAQAIRLRAMPCLAVVVVAHGGVGVFAAGGTP